MPVGDSMNQSQFELLLCLLHEGLPDRNRKYDIRDYQMIKGRGYFVFNFADLLSYHVPKMEICI